MPKIEPGAHVVLRRLGDQLGAVPTRPPGGSAADLSLAATMRGYEISGFADERQVVLGVALETSLNACFGECSYPFVDRIASLADIPSYRMDRSLRLDLPDPETWLTSKPGLGWLRSLQIGIGERVQITRGWAEAVLLPRDPGIDVERLTRFLASLDVLPAPVASEETTQPPSLDLELYPDLRDALELFADYLASDDVERDARITSAPTSDLEELVNKGSAILPALNNYLDRADELPGGPVGTDTYVQLHELGQAVAEGQLELLRRQGR